MKKIFVLCSVFLLSIFITACNSEDTCYDYEEYGFVDEVYYVETVNDLKNIPLDGISILKNDIDLEGVEWTPIGNDDDFYKGVFDGKGYSISNLSIISESSDIENTDVGLFGKAYSSVILNIDLLDVNIELTDDGEGIEDVNVGGLVGYGLYTYVSNVNVTGDIDVDFETMGSNVGGLAGTISMSTSEDEIESTVLDSSADVSINCVNDSSSPMVGGLLGCNSSLKVIKCYSIGNITVSSITKHMYVGGLIGFNSGNSDQTFSTGNVSVSSMVDSVTAGGHSGTIIGSVTNSYSTGDVTISKKTDVKFVGGFAGSISGEVSECYASGDVNDSYDKVSVWQGAFAGRNSNNIENVISLGSITNTQGTYYNALGVFRTIDESSNINIYRMQGAVYYSDSYDDDSCPSIDEDIITKDWYKDTLKFSEDIWDFENDSEDLMKLQFKEN